MDITDVISPLSVAEFVQRYLSREFVVLSGNPSKFSELVPWSELNEVLQSIRVQGNRLRLIENGVSVDPKRYLRNSEQSSSTGSALDGQAFTSLVRGGATINLNLAEELFPALRRVVESCEDEFRLPGQANLYAAWRSQQGFNLHWDDHDTLVLQVAGRKMWNVYAPTLPHPIRNNPPVAPRPTVPPVWSGVLNQGELLYMPRGWWHEAKPIDGPTLHVTIGLPHPKGHDFMSWLSHQMGKHVIGRMPVPHLAGANAQVDYAKTLRRHLVEELTDDAVERFMLAWDRRALPRPRVRLPEAVEEEGNCLRPETILRLVSTRRLHLDSRTGTTMVAFEAAARSWNCDERLRPALEMLRQSRSRTFSELADAVSPELKLPLRLLVEMLIRAGGVTLEQPLSTAAENPTIRSAENPTDRRGDEPQFVEASWRGRRRRADDGSVS